MPFCEIPPASLAHLGMFGFQVLREDGDFLLIGGGGRGIQIVDKARPVVWFDDVADALQMGAVAIIQT